METKEKYDMHFKVYCNNASYPNRAVASLTGQDFHFLHFASNFDQSLLFFLKLFSFSSSFWTSGWATRPPGKALATPLYHNQSLTVLYSVINLSSNHMA